MCGIVGLFCKSEKIRSQLGLYLGQMLVEMTERGPDSAGIAIYRNTTADTRTKLTVFSPNSDYGWELVSEDLSKFYNGNVSFEVRANHATFDVPGTEEGITAWLHAQHADLKLTSSGRSIEIYKAIGQPSHVAKLFNVEQLTGTHALGHTRMATESAVTIEHSHPFSTGEDLCLVHNGSLSNHNRLRRILRKKGIIFHTDNDSEVAAGYITSRLQQGDDLEQALEAAIHDLDGFYTFAVGTKDGFAVMRDPIACKPAIIAETDDWVAMASEYRAIAALPGAKQANCWEPEKTKIYSWKH